MNVPLSNPKRQYSSIKVLRYLEMKFSSGTSSPGIPKALIPVHLYGNAADMERIVEIAKTYNLYIIEDVAQAFGGEYNGQKLGTIGDLGCYSFFPSKNLGCFGDGGMVVTNDEGLSEKVQKLRQHGGVNKYNVDMLGHNSRLDALQAAVLSVKLKYIDEWNEKRRQVASVYTEGLKSIRSVSLPVEQQGARHVYNLYTIRTSNRDGLKNFLKDKGISTGIYYPYPLHSQQLFLKRGKVYDVPVVAERVSREVPSLPIDPLQTDEETHYVIECIMEFHRYRSNINS